MRPKTGEENKTKKLDQNTDPRPILYERQVITMI
jgi:hypothetical protein